MQPIRGLHHITAVAGDPQTNVDFYHHILGQRLIKTTVNFDDPGTYHMYYGDQIGTPGTVLTFFPWRGMPRGVAGNGEAAAVAYAISPDSVGFWQTHLSGLGIEMETLQKRYGAETLAFRDPDGMRLELVVDDHPLAVQYWQEGPIPQQHALRGFHSVTLWLDEVDATAALLVDQFGYRFVAQEGNRTRYAGVSEDIGLYVDLVHRPDGRPGRFGSGSIHHIAFRTPDDDEQQIARRQLLQAGYPVTTVQDRQYFHSIYFRSPGHVLFEIATDTPGFTLDEAVEDLGQSLKLPPWLEPQRQEIQNSLPTIRRRSLRAVEGERAEDSHD